jgi:hypothetical protein
MQILVNFSILLLLSFSGSAQPTESKYCNTRFNFCITYSSTLLPQTFVSDNGDGIILNTKDEKVEASVIGSLNISSQSTAELFVLFVPQKNKHPEVKILEKEINERHYETTFIKGETIIYQKLFNTGDHYVLIEIVAPKGEQFRMEKIKETCFITFDI